MSGIITTAHLTNVCIVYEEVIAQHLRKKFKLNINRLKLFHGFKFKIALN